MPNQGDRKVAFECKVRLPSTGQMIRLSSGEELLERLLTMQTGLPVTAKVDLGAITTKVKVTFTNPSPEQDEATLAAVVSQCVRMVANN